MLDIDGAHTPRTRVRLAGWILHDHELPMYCTFILSLFVDKGFLYFEDNDVYIRTIRCCGGGCKI